MMRSLNSAVAGLRSHQTKMDVIGNNIANVNTYGFKGSRTTFSDVFYQNLSTGSGATSGAGGTNPTQIGYGASVATVDVMNTVAGSGSTDRALDVYLAGEGFLVSKDSSGKQLYSRLGNLKFDGAGNLCDGNGQFIQGFPQNPDGSAKISADGTVTAGELQGIKVAPEILDKLKGISISKTGAIVGSMPGDPVLKTEVLPPFLNGNKMSIPKDSSLQGDVKLIVGALPSITDFSGALTSLNVSAVEFGDKGLPLADGTKHAYAMSYDDSTSQVTLKDTIDGATYTGYVKDGKVTLQNAANKAIAMTLTLKPTAGKSISDEPLGGDMQSGAQTPKTAALTSANFAAASALNVAVNSMSPANLNMTAGVDANISYEPTSKKMTFTTSDTPAITYTGIYDAATKAVTLTSPGKVPISMTLAAEPAALAAVPMTVPAAAALPGTGQLKYQLTTSDKGDNIVKLPATGPMTMPLANGKLPLDGLMDIDIDTTNGPVAPFSGSIGRAGPGEEQIINIGNLALAKIRNPGGMLETGSSYFEGTFNSGDPVFVKPSLDGTGETTAGYLELSNVDVSKEFTDMITTQRGFQANSRIITVSDSMLEELVNLKR